MHNKVGRIIRAAREAKGIAQAALSKTTGIAVHTIRFLFQGNFGMCCEEIL